MSGCGSVQLLTGVVSVCMCLCYSYECWQAEGVCVFVVFNQAMSGAWLWLQLRAVAAALQTSPLRHPGVQQQMLLSCVPRRRKSALQPQPDFTTPTSTADLPEAPPSAFHINVSTVILIIHCATAVYCYSYCLYFAILLAVLPVLCCSVSCNACALLDNTHTPLYC